MESDEVRESEGCIKRLNALILYSVTKPTCIKHQKADPSTTLAMDWSRQDDRQRTREEPGLEQIKLNLESKGQGF